MDTKPLQLQPLFGSEPDSWRGMNAHLFRSDESLRFFLRQHRERLIRDRAITKPAGRWLCAPDVMTRSVFEIGRELAAREATHA